jgi:hypothetical protein
VIVPGHSHRQRRAAIAALVAAGVLGALAWWWWPAASGRGNGTDVVVIGAGDVAAASGDLVARLREHGLSVDVAAAGPADWCTAAANIANAGNAAALIAGRRVVVIGFPALGPCDGDPVGATLDRLAGVDVVVVAQPGPASDAVRLATAARDVLLVDPAQLLGNDVPGARLACQWWDDCADGFVVARAADGSLTAAGSQRVARAIAADIR